MQLCCREAELRTLRIYAFVWPAPLPFAHRLDVASSAGAGLIGPVDWPLAGRRPTMVGSISLAMPLAVLSALGPFE